MPIALRKNETIPGEIRRSVTPAAPAQIKSSLVRMARLWPAGPGPRTQLISVMPTAVDELARAGAALEIPDGIDVPADLFSLFFAPPAIELQPLTGEYQSATAFEQAFLARCPLLQVIGSTLDRCGRNLWSVVDRLPGGPDCRRYPSRLMAPGDIDLHFPPSIDSMEARRELLGLLELQVKAQRRAEIWSHYLAGRVVASKCRDDAAGELEEIGVTHLQRPSTVLRVNRLHLRLSIGRVAWDIAKVVCGVPSIAPAAAVEPSPAAAQPPLKAELLFERWFAPQVSRPPTKPKDDYWAEAKRLFPKLSRRAFERARAKLVAGNEQWTQAGRRFNR